MTSILSHAHPLGTVARDLLAALPLFRIGTNGSILPDRIRRRFRVEHGALAELAAIRVAPRGSTWVPHRLLLLPGDKGAIWDRAAGLVERCGAELVVLPDQASAGLDAIEAAYLELAVEVRCGAVMLIGDGGAADRAVALARRLRDRDRPMPAGLLLFAPACEAADDQADLAGLPPTLVLAGTRDRRLADAWRFAERCPDAVFRDAAEPSAAFDEAAAFARGQFGAG